MRKSAIFLALALSACGSSKSDSTNPGKVDPGTTNPNNAIPGSTVDPNTGMGTDPNNGMPLPTGSGFNSNATINPVDPTKTYGGPTMVPMGRMIAQNSNWQFNWAGSSFTVRPQAQSVTINVAVPGSNATASFQYLDVTVDGALQPTPIKLDATTTAYTYALPDTNPHIVTFSLRTEANYGRGVLTFTGITATGGTLLPTETITAPKQIEFIGDSITNGYGVLSQQHNPPLGMNNGCSVNGNYTGYVQDSSLESASYSFSTLTAKHFGAQYHLVASSGRGVYRNGTTTADPTGTTTPNMPTLWQHTLHPYSTDISGTTVTNAMWTPDAAWAPQAVVINLGTNDFANHGTTADPNANPLDSGAFTTAYANLIKAVNTKYPQALIFPVVGPMLSGQNKALCIPAINAAITNAQSQGVPASSIAALVDAGVQDVSTPTSTGCEYHPLPTTQAGVSTTLVAAIKASTLAWQ